MPPSFSLPVPVSVFLSHIVFRVEDPRSPYGPPEAFFPPSRICPTLHLLCLRDSPAHQVVVAAVVVAGNILAGTTLVVEVPGQEWRIVFVNEEMREHLVVAVVGARALIVTVVEEVVVVVVQVVVVVVVKVVLRDRPDPKRTWREGGESIREGETNAFRPRCNDSCTPRGNRPKMYRNRSRGGHSRTARLPSPHVSIALRSLS